jgi:nucleoside-diphosphate-sugar epimerase
VLFAVGYDRSGKADPSPSPRDVFIGGLQNVLERVDCRRFIYISTTGVFGAGDGGWVHEESPPEPAYETARLHLEAEQMVLSWRQGARVTQGEEHETTTGGPPVATVLRLAGLYGPGRVPRLGPLLAGEPISCAREGWLNLIHVEDAASAVIAVAELADPPPLLLVSDGQPVQRREFCRAVCRLAGAPEPRFVEPPADTPAQGRGASDRRIDNSAMCKLLGIQLKYPSYREGLAHCICS